MIPTNLFFHYLARGPGMVVKNLQDGLEQAGIYFINNDYDTTNCYMGYLQGMDHINGGRFGNALCGPNLFSLPTDWGQKCKLYKHYIVPSQWIADLYRQFAELDHATIDIWPVGIDTQKWQRISGHQPGGRALIYRKHRSKQDLKDVLTCLGNLPYEVIEYDNYVEQDLFDACNRCSYAILLTGTEAQGIAYMQILSMGLPCYIWNINEWNNNGYICLSTSTPYFDEEMCGMKQNTICSSLFETFLDKLNSYKPRQFIEQNFTLKQKAQEYYALLTRYDCKVVI